MIATIRTNRLLFLAILLLISAGVADIIHRSDLKYSLQTSTLSRLLDGKEKKSEDLLNQLILNRTDLLPIIDRHTKFIESNEYSIIHYNNNNLQFWSDNRYTLPEILDEDIFNKPLVNLQGRIFVVKRASDGDDLIICLISLYKESRIENEIVKSGFDKSFKMPVEAGIAYDPGTGSQVLNREGEYLFSVTYSEEDKFNTWFVLIPLLLWFFFIVTLILLVNRLNSFIAIKGFGFMTPLVTLFVFGALYLILLVTGKPDIIVNTDLFSPFRFTIGSLIPSPGHMLLLSLVFFYMSWSFYRWVRIGFGRNDSRIGKLVLMTLYLSISALIFLLYSSLLKEYITGSNISFEIHKILDIDYFTLVAFISTSLFLIGLVIVLLKILKSVDKMGARTVFMAALLSLVVIVIVIILSGENPVTQIIIWSALLITTWIFRSTTSGMINISVVFALITGTYASYFIHSESGVRELNNLKVLAVNYSADNDLFAESILGEDWEVLKSDSVLSSMMNMQLFTNEEAELVYEYLDKTYFSGYWENYERVYTICNYDSKLLIDGSEGDSEDCFDFFREKMRMSSVLFNDTNLVFMENNSGRAYYIGSAFFNATDGSTNGLFIELVDKIKYIQSGYPELLLDKRYFTQQLLKNYSIGKYLSDTLVIQTGTFPFSAIQRIPNNKSVEFNHFKEEGNQYLIYNFSEKSSLIIEWPSLRFLDIVVTFTYFFVGFFIMFFLSILSINPPGRFSLSRLDFRQKMQTAFIIILLGTMISIGGVVIFLSVGQYRGKHLENIKEKLSSVNIELEHKLSSELMLNSDWYAPGYPTLDDLLIKFSNVFYTDINLYDSDGHLLASSRREVFDKELAGTRMNYFALNALSKRGDSRYIHQEKIGELTFLSAYVPFYNSDNQLLAYLNLPYFNMQSKLTEEISNLVVAIVNFSLILLVISMGFAIYIAGRITSPLRMLREGLASVKLGEESNQLSYRGEDEIGELVKQYNIMLRELNQSAIKLARSEREDAWREMAKQIAHEIKNPLTPMKLNVQQLEKSWKDGSKEFEERLGRFTETQIEQIDNLSSIATEFSNFARMPKASPGKTNLVAVVKNAAELFSDIRNIDLKLETNSLDEVIIFADREQLNSMLTNLIRNGVQAIPAKRKGVIQIELKIESDKVLLSICDNGIGIPDELSEKLFAPNFTTKSSGMGLGLAIVKRIVETANGQVWFRSNSDIGTTFFVKYPIISFK